jgi:hypothetical protein
MVERGRELVVVIRLNGPERRLLRDSNTSEIRGQADLTGARSKRRLCRVGPGHFTPSRSQIRT